METPEKNSDSGQALERVNHRFPMPVYAPVRDDQGLREFDSKALRALNVEPPLEYAVEPSIEGVTVEIIYENGSFASASTRGDGIVGEDITRNIKTILTVPLGLERLTDSPPIPELVVVWGRIYMETEPYQALNRSREASGLVPYANPAEAAADSLRQSNPRVTAKRPLNLFCRHTGGPVHTIPSETYYSLMLTIQQWGLRVNRPNLHICKGVEEVIEYCYHLKESRTDLPYPVDGTVIYVNQLSYEKHLGDVSSTARWAAVYKFL